MNLDEHASAVLKCFFTLVLLLGFALGALIEKAFNIIWW